MNRQRAKELLPTIKAFSEGKEIEFKMEGCDEWEKPVNSFGFSWDNNVDYRIAPSATPRTIEDGLEVGDVIEDQNGDRRILAVCGEIIATSYAYHHDSYFEWYVLKELIDRGCKLVQPKTEDDTIEMTLEEVAELKGVDVDKLRIKD